MASPSPWSGIGITAMARRVRLVELAQRGEQLRRRLFEIAALAEIDGHAGALRHIRPEGEQRFVCALTLRRVEPELRVGRVMSCELPRRGDSMVRLGHCKRLRPERARSPRAE